jgi:F420 biosynthesis protein FbiB-like protein
MTNDLMEFILSRRSVRVFEDRQVEEEKLERILNTATHAPSAHNSQPWRFVVFNSKLMRRKIADVMNVDYKAALERSGMSVEQITERMQKRSDRIIDAGTAVMLCLDSGDMNKFPEDEERQEGELIMGVQSVALAGGNLLLAAHAEKLGGVWTCAPLFTQSSIVLAFDLPESWLPQALLLLGYPAEKPGQKELKPIKDVTLFLE